MGQASRGFGAAGFACHQHGFGGSHGKGGSVMEPFLKQNCTSLARLVLDNDARCDLWWDLPKNKSNNRNTNKDKEEGEFN